MAVKGQSESKKPLDCLEFGAQT
ncbi:uncharacterized protein G2W53_038662 [Senna tora]|uniref:Uncharacterized protein n=1 Tax=Senna tora TaxID=362788 RepID=A0A834SNN2_9FABA|nr:uncharacterized protein G2W53_038662 [Senna tora]